MTRSSHDLKRGDGQNPVPRIRSMSDIDAMLERSRVHAEWRPLLCEALAAVDPGYLRDLLQDRSWLPGADNLLAAFRRDRAGLRYILVGESPYPRRESANGIAFYDAAVGDLWSESGLSKAVNRATSLRNIVKAALAAESLVETDADGRITQQAISRIDKRGLVQSLEGLFHNLEDRGFLLLNATPVLHPARKPALEARFWRAFLDCLLRGIKREARQPVTLILWGRIAGLIESLPASAGYDKLVCEHPYNISFIDNPAMLRLLANLRILQANPGPVV